MGMSRCTKTTVAAKDFYSKALARHTTMSNFQKISLLFMVLFLQGKPVISKNRCRDKCGDIHILFPFYLKNNKLNNTMYPPGFDLFCNERGETVLELPAVSIKLFVERIDYKSQQIQIYDPENCLAKVLSQLGNSSVYPFKFKPLYGDVQKSNASVFLCNSTSCPIVKPSYRFLINPDIISCTKVKDILSVEWFYQEDLRGYYDEFISIMEWSKPNCSHCEAQGQMCKWKNGTLGIIVGLILLLLLVKASFHVFDYYEKKGEDQARIEKFLEDYRAMKPTRFTYADIKRITNGFSESLGEGAHGAVFKGMLSREILVAVKKLNDTLGDGKDFINEVGTMGKIHHVNIVRLLGFCADEFHRALVYDFFPNGSLQRFLAPPDNKDVFLGWEKLQQIALGVARGIEYLHLGCDHRILHFDINPHNVLLDDNFVPKITDFGLSKLCPKNQSIVSMTAARGTLGYIAPEVFSRKFGNVSYKSDIYSYGMLLLEMVGGRKNMCRLRTVSKFCTQSGSIICWKAETCTLTLRMRKMLKLRRNLPL
ncbi:unnamed protein product [Sphenostylis stenocarpa]|uniref:Protein kinase domain-containing protein n=1 Tax=Sphenostylis stenocarpa TaxID=92480 RepID=A0AA86T5P9_9FABA|nr:unnamed protein product [Sphenostylis stenocarpa]